MSENFDSDLEGAALPEQAQAPALVTKKKFRWGRNKFIALGAAVLLLGGGGAWAYSVYQAPTTVIGMAIGSLFGQPNPAYDITVSASGDALQGADGTLAIKVSSGDVGADVRAVLALDLGGQKAGATIEALTAKSGNVYFAFSNFKTLISLVEATGILPSTADLSAIDGKWVKLTKAEIDQLSGSTGSATTCIQEKLKDKAHAEAVRSEMINLAKAHEFMVVSKELGTKDGSVGYDMAFDVPQLKAFLTSAIDTKAFADYTACAGTATSLPSKAEMVKAIAAIDAAEVQKTMKNITFSLWADQFSHKLAKLSLFDKEHSMNLSVVLVPAGDRSSEVKIPADTISVSDLQAALMGAFVQK